MIIALQLSGALLLTVTLLIITVVLAGYELGHRVTRDHEQRQFDLDGSRFTNGSRLGRPSRAMRHATTLAVVAVLATFAGGSLAHAEAPQECRNQCYVDLENCRDGCVESGGGFGGCKTDCGWFYEHCADRCDESKTTAR